MIVFTLALLLPTSATGASVVESFPVADSYYLLARPADLADDELVPLIVALHGTDTDAADILDFWSERESTIPFAIVAPQSMGQGWRSEEVAFLTRVVADAHRRLNVDSSRFLLTGHSAGGAMALHMLYAEHMAASAVAVTANYLPPTFPRSSVAARSRVPVYYAVGRSDTNFEPMRAGIEMLRAEGVNVTVARPHIGHTLDAAVAQAALRWFERLCRSNTQRVLDDANQLAEQQNGDVGSTAKTLEQLVERRATHPEDQVKQARAVLAVLLAPGRAMLATAQELIDADRLIDAYHTLVAVEQRYRTLSLANEARAYRERIESHPVVQAYLGDRRRVEQSRAAAALWHNAVAAVRESKLAEARRQCANLVALYPESEQAKQARAMLGLLGDGEFGR